MKLLIMKFSVLPVTVERLTILLFSARLRCIVDTDSYQHFGNILNTRDCCLQNSAAE
jgi:hypothetical protein